MSAMTNAREPSYGKAARRYNAEQALGRKALDLMRTRFIGGWDSDGEGHRSFRLVSQSGKLIGNFRSESEASAFIAVRFEAEMLAAARSLELVRRDEVRLDTYAMQGTWILDSTATVSEIRAANMEDEEVLAALIRLESGASKRELVGTMVLVPEGSRP